MIMRRTVLLILGLLMTAATTLQAQETTPYSQMEKLGRGVVAIRANAFANILTWRLLGTDAPNATFDVVCDGNVVAEGLTLTNYKHSGTAAKQTSKYQIITRVDGQVVDTSREVETWSGKYLSLKLDRPAKGKQGGEYTPNDMSVGDVDGDGEYELFVKWDPSNSKDNSQSGNTDNVIIDCYKLDGTKLWRVDLGQNIRAGAHYTQYMVYDFDGDGRAEMMCKTAPGSIDGTGEYVNQAATDDKIKEASNTKVWRNDSGRIDGGQEYLTVFDGETGKAIHTIAYNPNRNATSTLSDAGGDFNWATNKTDNHSYNRGDRFLAAVAYIDGPDSPASGIFCRGYYTYAFIWAVSFDGTKLIPRWLHRSNNANGSSYSVVTYDAEGKGTVKSYAGNKSTSGSGSGTMFGNGNHNLTLGDVDGDGCDEIIWGSGAVDQDGKLLYGTGFGHGDAIHMGKMMPDRQGYQVFQVHEEGGPYSWDLHDAATGEIIRKGGSAGVDNGRGMAGDVVASNRGWEFWSADGAEHLPRSAATGLNDMTTATPSMNFRIYWDGSYMDQMLDGGTANNKLPSITKVEGNGIKTVKGFTAAEGTPRSCNSSKSTPCLSADIFGDWREEVIFWDGNDPSKINIYTTTEATEYRVPTLMHDHIYRMAICWQNVAYNQPPHLGYYLRDYVEGKIDLKPTGISQTKAAAPAVRQVYDLQGRQQSQMKRGLNIIREGGTVRKVFY